MGLRTEGALDRLNSTTSKSALLHKDGHNENLPLLLCILALERLSMQVVELDRASRLGLKGRSDRCYLIRVINHEIWSSNLLQDVGNCGRVRSGHFAEIFLIHFAAERQRLAQY